MKKVLVPVDFSDNALVAARYAVTLAKRMDWTVHLLHTYLPFSSTFAEDEFNEEISDYETEKAIKNMSVFCDQLNQEFAEEKITSQCENGVLSEVLLKQVNQDEYALIVMGTKGASGLKHVILGSNTFEIIKKAPIPVVAVPDYEFDTNFSRIGLLTNFKPSEVNVLESFIDKFGKPATLVLFHILEKNSKRQQSDLDAWADDIKKTTGIERIECVTEQMVGRFDVKEDFPDSIFDLTESKDLQILLVTKERRTFISKLFSRSLVKALAHQLKTPIYFNAG